MIMPSRHDCTDWLENGVTRARWRSKTGWLNIFLAVTSVLRYYRVKHNKSEKTGSTYYCYYCPADIIFKISTAERRRAAFFFPFLFTQFHSLLLSFLISLAIIPLGLTSWSSRSKLSSYHINASASEPSDPFTVSSLEKIINHIPLNVC